MIIPPGGGADVTTPTWLATAAYELKPHTRERLVIFKNFISFAGDISYL